MENDEIELMAVTEETAVELLIETGEPPVQRESESAEGTLNLSQMAAASVTEKEEA